MGTLENIRIRFGISGSVLKMIAIVCMLIDHTGAAIVRKLVVYSNQTARVELARAASDLYPILRHIGRPAFPIFCFMLVEGFLHTRNVKKYVLRMSMFALISEFPFDYALHHGQSIFTKQNVYFTLLIGLLVLWGVRECSGKIALQMMIMVMGMIGARLLRTDYSYHGVFIIELLYVMRFSWMYQAGTGAAYLYNYENWYGSIAFIPIALYNGKRGRQMKYFFYWFYPVHLLIIGIITYRILPPLMGIYS